jgi:hypothetical protein
MATKAWVFVAPVEDRGQALGARRPLNRPFTDADESDMGAALLEPISPELALVCPELRQQAIAALPDFTWQVFVAKARAQVVPQAPERTAGVLAREARQAAVEMFTLLVPFASAAFVCVTLVTLAMTLIADALR